MTAFAKLAGIQTKTTLREPAAAFFMLALGPMLVIFLGLMFGSDPHLVSFPAFVVAIVGLIITPIDIVTQRENGSLRRFRATPLPPLTYIAADVLVRFVICLVSITVMLTIVILPVRLAGHSEGDSDRGLTPRAWCPACSRWQDHCCG